MASKSKRTLDEIFADFIQYFNQYTEDTYPDNESAEANLYKFDKLAHAGMDLLEAAANSCHFKDSFESFYCPGEVMDVHIESKKTGTAYRFACDWQYYGLYFEANIYNSEYIKNLQDDFILDFFSTCKKHGFQYIDDRRGTSGNSIFHASIKSDIFKLFRNYTADILSDGKEDFDAYKHTSLGYFQKEWKPQRIDIQNLYDDLCVAMKYFYKFNYHLWKAKDSEEKIKMKKLNNKDHE